MRLLSRLDLNLLVALDALLTERSVTRAAERLHLSQPALSASLSRLRTHFDDQILARRGNTYELTPFAVRLTEHTDHRPRGRPTRVREPGDRGRRRSRRASSRSTAPTTASSPIGTIVSQLAAERAPGVRFRYMLHNPAIVEDAANRLRSADAMVIPHGPVSDLPYLDLWQDDWLAVVADDNATIGDDADDAEPRRPALGAHVSSPARPSPRPPGRSSSSAWSRTSRWCSRASSRSAHFVSGTRRVGLCSRRSPRTCCAIGGIRVVPLPFAATPLVSALWWHPSTPATPSTSGCAGCSPRRAAHRRRHARSSPAAACRGSFLSDTDDLRGIRPFGPMRDR